MNTTSAIKCMIVAIAATLSPTLLLPTLVLATEPMRVWVDQSGRFSIEARLVEINDASIVLLRKTGGTVVLSRDKISDRDEAYLDEVKKSLEATPNLLRIEPPKLPEFPALPILDLPDSDFSVEEESKLILSRATVTPKMQLPEAIEPDPLPLSVEFVSKRYVIGKLDSYDVVSQIHSVRSSTTYVSDTEVPAIALSISSGLRLPGQAREGRIVRFDASSNHPTVMWQGSDTIRMFDHHLPSGRSLVLVGHSPVGHGGQFAIATGWDRDENLTGNRLQLSHRRSLPAPETDSRLQTVRWARWIDEEHICTLLDRSIVVWNLVSGEQLFRIDGISEKSEPVLSAGRRYVAVPGIGTVDLYRTSDGKALGRISVEANSIPGVGFAPRGDAMAITTTRRLRVWDLAAAALRSDIQSRNSLGNDQPIWVDDDLVMSSSGVLMSQFRGVPVWQYEMTGASTSSIGSQVAVLRKTPVAELSVVTVPHAGANDAIKWIDSSPRAADIHEWRIPGRSVWTDGQWADRDVRLSSLGTDYK